MKVLLLHHEDSPRSGPWTRQKWDLLVDLGKSSEAAAAATQKELGCPVLRLDSLREGTRDLTYVGNILRAARGRLLDSEGLDWWELTGILVHTELELSMLVLRLVGELRKADELFASRPGWPANACAALLNRDLHAFRNGAMPSMGRQFDRYRQALQNFSFSQIAEIFFDKHDPHYKWRRISRGPRRAAACPVVLVPSAYVNVSRMAAAYAHLLPDQQFLFVATRRSATRFELPPNVMLAALSAYSPASESHRELACLL